MLHHSRWPNRPAWTETARLSVSDSDSHRAAKQIKGRSQPTNQQWNQGQFINFPVRIFPEVFRQPSTWPHLRPISLLSKWGVMQVLHFNPSSPPHTAHSSRLARHLCRSLICPPRPDKRSPVPDQNWSGSFLWAAWHQKSPASSLPREQSGGD